MAREPNMRIPKKPPLLARSETRVDVQFHAQDREILRQFTR